MPLVPFVVNQTLEASFTSLWFALPDYDSQASLHVFLDNTDSAGSYAIQGTNFPGAVPESFVVLALTNMETGVTSTSIAVSAGVDINDGYHLVPAVFERYRLVFTRTAGSAANLLSIYLRMLKGDR